MKKVLIITYYWPPGGGSAVLRWLKFSKYLPELGWKPIIYTPGNPSLQEIDEELLNEIPKEVVVIKKSIWEPYNLYKIFSKKSKSEKISSAFISEKKSGTFSEKISVWIRGNLFIPDARKFWIRPSVKYLFKYLKENPVDLIVSTGPPHSMHLIALMLKQKLPVKWVADFRDPWTNIDFYRELKLTKVADKKHHKLEKEVIKTADIILTVGPTMTEEFKKMGGINVITITNGFDEEDIKKEVQLDKEFSILHLGSIPKSRNPLIFWNVISELVKENNEFSKQLKVKLIGNIDYSVKESIQKFNLEKFVKQIAFIPHNEAQIEIRKAQVLLLLINNSKNAKGILTNKFFEYLGAKRPILAIGPEEGDVAKILNDTNSGVVIDFTDKDKIKSQIQEWYKMYLQNKLKVNSRNIDYYSRKHLTKALTEQFSLL